MHVIMISIGDGILSNPVGDALERQKEYAYAVGHIDMIVYSPKTHQLETKHFENLSIYPTKSINMATFIYDAIKIANQILKTKKIDVITVQDPFGTALVGYLLKKKHHIPLHIQNHSCFLNNKEWISEKPFLFTFFNQIAHFTLKQANRLRVVNAQEKQKYIDILGISENKIDIAPIPINVEFWQTEPSKEEKEVFLQKYNIDPLKPVLSWAGRPVNVKNLPYLFKSVQKIHEVVKTNFLVAGDMKQSYWNLKELEQEHNITPIYLGLLTHHELKTMYYLTSIYLHTSNYEGFGLVVSDAQACGTVVVSRNTAGTSDIIENNSTGYLINGNEEEFSKKTIELLSDPKMLTKMQSNAKKMIYEKFNKKRMLQRIIDSLQTCVIP